MNALLCHGNTVGSMYVAFRTHMLKFIDSFCLSVDSAPPPPPNTHCPDADAERGMIREIKHKTNAITQEWL